MNLNLEALLKEGKINRIEFQAYLTFCANDVGREFLNQMVESVLMEEACNPTSDLFAWHDGRRSIWRDIKIMLRHVEQELGEYNDR